MELDVLVSKLKVHIDGQSLPDRNRTVTPRIRPCIQVRIAVARGSCHHVDMAPTDDQTAEHQQRLAALVAQRRAQLRLKKQEAHKVCDLSYMTYWKIEDGQSVRPSSYQKLEVGFNFRAGSCKAILDGSSDSVVLEDGTRLIAGGQIRDYKSGALEEEIDRAFDKSAQLTAPDITLSQARAMKEDMLRELRERGVLKSE